MSTAAASGAAVSSSPALEPPSRDGELPVRDVRVIVADPTQGARAMLGSWGEGIWLTEDGGRSWKKLGLRTMQVRSLAVDWRHRRAWAASANLLFHRGVYSRSF